MAQRIRKVRWNLKDNYLFVVSSVLLRNILRLHNNEKSFIIYNNRKIVNNKNKKKLIFFEKITQYLGSIRDLKHQNKQFIFILHY